MNGIVRILRHGLTMVRRNFRSYALLSVTILLSFSLLLGYLLFTDSTLYTRYRFDFSKDPRILSVTADYPEDSAKLLIARDKVQSIGTTYTYISHSAQCRISGNRYALPDGRPVELPDNTIVYAVPAHIWALYLKDSVTPVEITWLDGREAADVSLKSGQMLMSLGLFHALGLEEEKTPEYSVDLHTSYVAEGGETFQKNMRVVGVFAMGHIDQGDSQIQEALTEESLLHSDPLNLSAIVIPLEDFDPDLLDPDYRMGSSLNIYSDSPELVSQALEQMHFKSGYTSAWEIRNEVKEKMRTENHIKAIIAAALVVLLGINLYSSFNNALNDRRFEIGVKRAVGASGFSVVRQFLYESLFVMCLNILLSVALVTDVGIAYKFIYEHLSDEYGFYHRFVLYISPYSIAMFAVCTLSLTVVFSLIFAYKSTQVEVVDYLKAE